MDLFFKLILNLIMYFVIVLCENSGQAVVLSSVYDAMRNNWVEDTEGRVRHNQFNYELRNKRNINERWDVDKGQRDEQVYLTPQQPFLKGDGYRDSDTGEDAQAAGNDLICSVYKPNNERLAGNPFLDHENWKVFGGVGYFLGKAVKFVLSGIALVSLPLIFLVAVGIPLKILLSLKAVTLTNSVVFGSLIYRLLNRFLRRPFPQNPNNNNNNGNNNNNNNINDNNGNLDNSIAFRPQILDKVDQSQETDNDYTDYNEEKLQKIIESIKNKNKDW